LAFKGLMQWRFAVRVSGDSACAHTIGAGGRESGELPAGTNIMSGHRPGVVDTGDICAVVCGFKRP